MGQSAVPFKSHRIFFFAGYDQHIFHVPMVVRFSSCGSVLVPQTGTGAQHGDYENYDKSMVFAAAAQFNTMSGNYGSEYWATPAL